MAALSKIATDMPAINAGGTIAGGGTQPTPVGSLGPGSEPWRKLETYRPGEPFRVERPPQPVVPPFTIDPEKGLVSGYRPFANAPPGGDAEVIQQLRPPEWVAARNRRLERMLRLRPR